MRLNSITIENFKGIKSRQALFNDLTEISGRNGTGKTTVYDAFLWCMFGKDSMGQAQFGIEPVGGSASIPKVEIVIDGSKLCKELHATNPKTRCTIDGLTKSITEYKAYVASMISEDTFKTLTDVHYVCSTMHWTERRNLLLSLAGDIGSPIGFDDLLAEVQGKPMIDFKKLCQKEKLRITTKRDEIQPRIDEIQRGLDGYAGTDESAKQRRTAIQGELGTLETARQQLLTQAQERERVVAQVQALRTKQIVRESFLRTDNSRVAALIQEKNALAQEAQQWASDKQSAEWAINEKKRVLGTVNESLEQAQGEIQHVRTQYRTVNSEEPVKGLIGGTCPTCRQQLPNDQLAEIGKTVELRYQTDITEKNRSLQALRTKGDGLNEKITEYAAAIEKLVGEIVAMEADLIKMIEETALAAKANITKLQRIDAQIAADVKVAPEGDQEWLNLSTDIEALTVGESVADQLTIIENGKSELNAELVTVNNTLAQADRAVQDKARIEELEGQEDTLNKQIMELEKRLNQIANYTRAESDMITAAVNGRFKHVTWRLFTELKNGGTEDACIPLLGGVPYSDLSYGERILVGLDIVNVLAAQYGVTVPLFVDNAESYTPEIEWCGQVIRLVHKKSQKTLKIA